MMARFLIEVHEQWRPGRGRWWAPKAEGYTDVLASAGFFSRAEAERRAGGSDRATIVPALPFLAAELDRARADVAVLQTLCDALIKGPAPGACTSCRGVGYFLVEDRTVCLRCNGSGLEPRCCAVTPCCDRRDEYNGFASGPTFFTCPIGCACHD